MSKALTVLGMVVAGLIVVLFLGDMFAPKDLRPFGGKSVVMDVGLIFSGILLGILSWSAYREQ